MWLVDCVVLRLLSVYLSSIPLFTCSILGAVSVPLFTCSILEPFLSLCLPAPFWSRFCPFVYLLHFGAVSVPLFTCSILEPFLSLCLPAPFWSRFCPFVYLLHFGAVSVPLFTCSIWEPFLSLCAFLLELLQRLVVQTKSNSSIESSCEIELRHLMLNVS